MSNNAKGWLLLIGVVILIIAFVVGEILFRIYLAKIGLDYLGEVISK